LSFLSRSIVLVAAVCALSPAACVSYRPLAASPQRSFARVPDVPQRPLTFEEAAQLVVLRNPELRAARARIAAVNLNPGPDPLRGSLKVADGDVTETSIGTDILALLGIGPRAAEKALARSIRSERIRAHHERARDLIGELALAYALERALADLRVPSSEFDVEAFTNAGLVSRSAGEAARAALVERDSERRILEAEQRDARRDIARLIGSGPEEEAAIVAAPLDWPTPPATNRQRLLLARGDIQRLYAQYCVADHRFRLAVAEQIPNVGLALGANADLQIPLQVLRVSLPLDAPAEARVSEAARAAAFSDLDAGVLNALHDAASTRLTLDAAEARFDGATARLEATTALLDAETGRLADDPQAFTAAVLVMGAQVQAFRELRRATIGLARARVAAARAAGWPTSAMVAKGGAR